MHQAQAGGQQRKALAWMDLQVSPDHCKFIIMCVACTMICQQTFRASAGGISQELKAAHLVQGSH